MPRALDLDPFGLGLSRIWCRWVHISETFSLIFYLLAAILTAAKKHCESLPTVAISKPLLKPYQRTQMRRMCSTFSTAANNFAEYSLEENCFHAFTKQIYNLCVYYQNNTKIQKITSQKLSMLRGCLK
ncbi:hypothetical protein IEQ34_022674 [Dendrobium chrysotoxum]|uniref:Uncharacterized protein n=1 Tax=Dendrobium chrysotoxum TaxID=161865 RepID=A0AAV7FK87_DENCH|nr:hypothetical protein IEQ34_022674 [Dendrobium chrysotoxum]